MCFKKDNGARSVSVLINTRSVSVSAVAHFLRNPILYIIVKATRENNL